MFIRIKIVFSLVGFSKITSDFGITEIFSNPGENKSVSSARHTFLLLCKRKTLENKDTNLPKCYCVVTEIYKKKKCG